MAISGVSGGSFTITRIDDGVSSTSTITANRGTLQVFDSANSNYLGNGNWDTTASGTANTLTASLIVNGVVTTPTATQWSYQNTSTGAFIAITGSETAFTISGTNLQVVRNLDDTTDFPANSLAGGSITIQVEHTFTVGNRTGLKSFQSIQLRRSEVTESSISYNLQAMSGPFWTSADASDKTFSALVYIGGSQPSAPAISYQWLLNATQIGTGQSVTVSRNDINSSATLTLRITHADIGTSVEVGSLELFDLLDQVYFVERVDSVVAANTVASALILPYQNGTPMANLTASNCEFRFRVFNTTTGAQSTFASTTGSTRGTMVNGTGNNTFTAGYYQNDNTTPGNFSTTRFVYRTAVQQDVDGASEGVILNVQPVEIERAGNRPRFDYEMHLISY